MTEININEICDVMIGNAENSEAMTGCTVILCEKGAKAGIDIRGGGPASRESGLLEPRAAAEKIHAVLLSGGSAFGLGAANGVMKYLKEKDIGFDTGITKVPLVCQSCIFDLGIGSSEIYPDSDMAYLACKNAEKKAFEEGSKGVGMGATVGKMCGAEYMQKSGVGAYAVRVGEIEIGAVVCVNALGDVYDESGNIIAGMLAPDKKSFANSEKAFMAALHLGDNLFTGNTTIGAVITNADFNKTQLCKIASMSQNGLARAIRPVHTSADGDTMYALSVGDKKASADIVGTIAAYVVQKAIERAVGKK